MISKKLYLAVFVITLFSANILAQGINWGLRFDAHAIRTTSNYYTHTEEMENRMYYPRFFTTPQLMLNIYPIKQAGVELRIGQEIFLHDFAGREYSCYVKFHFYDPLFLIGGVSLKEMDGRITYSKMSQHIDKIFGMPAFGIGGQITKHISAEIIYLEGNKRLIEYADTDFYKFWEYHRRETHLNYVIKLSAGFNWSIYDF